MQILERTDKISIYLITVLVNWRTIQILVVARTKVDGIFCSEFKYVISFFSLPDEVFKWCVLQYWRKPVPTSSYRQYILCLKGNIGWLSAIVCLWDVSSKCTVIISQHNVTPLGLVPLFHDISALVKSLSFQSLTDRDFLGINLSESLRNAPFKTYYTPYFCRILQDKPPHHHRFQPYDFPGGGIVVNDFHIVFSTSLGWYPNVSSCINSLIGGSTNTPSLFLASLVLGNVFVKYVDPLPWRNFLWLQIWCVEEVK